MGRDAKGLARIWEGALGLVYPPQCPCCGVPVAQQGGLCPDCWRDAGFITGLACAACGCPLPGDGETTAAGVALSCDGCLSRPHPWRRGAAALVYDGTGRQMVLAMKHGDRPDLAPVLGDWLAAAAAPMAVPDMVVVPVPVHPRRLLRRKYNQAALLAGRAAAGLGLPVHPAALRRTRHTPMQDHRSVADRFANQHGAICVSGRAMAAIAGRPVLLIDDVMASGATLGAAAEALIAAGSGPVSVAVVARAVKDH